MPLALQAAAFRCSLMFGAALLAAWHPSHAGAATATVQDVIAALTHMQARQQEADQKYRSLVATLHMDQWMSLSVVLDKKLRTQYRPEVARAQAGLGEYRQESARLRAQMKQYVGEIAGMDSDGPAFKRAFDAKSAEGEKLSNESLDNDRDIYTLVVRFYDFLDDPALRYRISQSKVVFETDADVNRYKAFFTELKRLTTRADQFHEIAAKRRADADEKMKALKRDSARTGNR
ncbi:MAG TPA: hypothetical protein VM051_08010 [Usitatibacter sp.]|nr:hypothetical protein [Usitatibacter sp.]